MGYMVHHAIIITGFQEDRATDVRAVAVAAFADVAPVSEVLKSPTNGFWTILVGPDGSKAGWPESLNGDVARKFLRAWLYSARADLRRPLYCSWAEVQYGDDEGLDRLLATHRYDVGETPT